MFAIDPPAVKFRPNLKMHDVVTDLILLTLEHFEGNRTYAAKSLGISLRSLRYRIQELEHQGIDVPVPKEGFGAYMALRKRRPRKKT